MPEEIEVETKELQEAIDELNEEKAERAAEEKRSGWTKYIGLSTAVLAVFAALGALQAGALINEALINQVKSSDTWNEYQASREKTHLYTVALNGILDTSPPSPAAGESKAITRAKEYGAEIKKEQQKSKDLSAKAKDLEGESAHQVHKHELFAYSVALIQVAIALSAIAALAKIKYVWYLSMVCGLVGIALFVGGVLPR